MPTTTNRSAKCSFGSHRVTAEHFTIFLRILFAAFPRYFLRYPFANPLFGKVFGERWRMGVRPNGGRNAVVQKDKSMTAIVRKSETMKALKQDQSVQSVLTLAEASSFLRVSERNLWQRAKSGDVPSFKIGVQHRFLVTELEAWAISQRKDFE